MRGGAPRLSERLLGAQREYGINTRRAVGGDQTGDERHRREQRDRGGRDSRIASFDAVQLRRDESAQQHGGGDTDRQTDPEEKQHFLHHQPDQTGRLRSEGQPNTELLAAPRDDECHDAVEADRRENRGEQAKPSGQQRDQSIGQQRFIELSS